MYAGMKGKIMKKKLINIIGMIVIAIGLVACGKDNDADKIDEQSTKTITADKLLSVYDFDLDKYVTLGEYKNLDVTLDGDYDVTEDEVIEYLNQYLSYGNTYVETDKKTVEEGDIVNIDYTGSIGGEEFEGGADSGAHLEIGSNTFIDGFEAGLVGKNVGETTDLNLKFPDDYWNEEYAGKDAVFTVKINSIDEENGVTYDTVTDEYVKESFGYETKQEWHDSIKSSLQNVAEQRKTTDAQNAIIEKIMETSTVNVPDTLIQKELDETVRQVEQYASANFDGMPLEDYLKQYENCDDEVAFREKIKAELNTTLEQQLLVDAIIKKENSSITEGGYAEFLAYYLDAYGMEEKEFYEQYGSKENIMLIYAENMVISKMVDDVVGTNGQ